MLHPYFQNSYSVVCCDLEIYGCSVGGCPQKSPGKVMKHNKNRGFVNFKGKLRMGKKMEKAAFKNEAHACVQEWGANVAKHKHPFLHALDVCRKAVIFGQSLFQTKKSSPAETRFIGIRMVPS